MSNLRLAVIAAMPQEAAAVEAAVPAAARERVRVIHSGVGAAAAQAVRELLAAPNPPELICSTGFCGGLADGVAVGDIVLAGAILGPNDGERYEVAFEDPGVDALRLALAEAHAKHHVGAIVSLTRLVCLPPEKRALGAARKALAVDMESYAIARAANSQQPIANGQQCAVFVLRVVSDCVDDELPAEVDSFVDDQGRVRLGQVARFALGGAKNTRTLLRLKNNAEKAAASLTAAWRAVLPACGAG